MTNNLPLNWCECKFEDVLDYEQPTRYIVANTDYQNKGIAVLTAGKSFILGYTNEKDGIFDASKEPVIIFDDFTTSSKMVKFPFKVKSSAMKILHAKDNIDIDFIYYLMQTIHYESDTHKRYWISEYAKQTISLPPLAEQERIVEKIEALFADIDEGIERLKSAQAQIKQYRQSVLKSAFEGKLYKTTEWVYNKLGNIFKTSSGGTPKRGNALYYGGTIPWLKSGELNNGLIMEAEEFITEDGIKNSSAKLFPKGSLLIALYGATVGKLGILGFDSATNQAICCIYQNKNYCRDFLFYYLQLKKDYLIKQGKGGAQPNISQEVVKSLRVPIPTLPEQQRIVEEIEKRFAVADELEKAVNEGLEKADKLKQSILKKAFEGKLAPQNPNDEPASVLLERIKKEQKPTKGKKK